VHALINRVFVITCNRTGSEGDLLFTGLSLIADPRGEVLAKASDRHTEVILQEIDVSLARDKDITPKNHLFDDRRPEEYVLLTRETNPPSSRKGAGDNLHLRKKGSHPGA
jgi:predicted amidohydrolase